MGRGKQSGEGQVLRRQQIIDYIRKNGPVKGSRICEDLEMSRSSLSDDIRAINIGGEIIRSPKKGLYLIDEQLAATTDLHRRIDGPSVRQWIILLSLLKKDRTFDEIMEFIAETGIPCSKSVLYNDLRALISAHMVTRDISGRQHRYSSDVLYETDLREIGLYTAKKATDSTRVAISKFSSIDLKIKRSIPGFEPGSQYGKIRHSGKQTILTEEQLQMLQSFEKFPYAERELLVKFTTNAGWEVSRSICVGIVVYVVETARIYLIGESSREDQNKDRTGKNYVVIPLDRITAVVQGKKVNTCYKTPEYYRIYREMFQISTEEPMKVCVRFENFPFIRDKIERLCIVRETAQMEIRGEEIIFKDTIRGRGDFARYLRRFGRSAIVEEPEQLREDMMSASRKILALYE